MNRSGTPNFFKSDSDRRRVAATDHHDELLPIDRAAYRYTRAKKLLPAGMVRVRRLLLTRVMGTPILFSPENVRNVLVKLPSVAALLPDPALEGEPSDA